MPRNPAARLILPNGINVGVRIIDISLSGAGIATEHRPEVGSLVTLGKIPGRVVRHLEDGFAIEFTRLQHPDLLEENVTGRVNAAFPRSARLAAADAGATTACRRYRPLHRCASALTAAPSMPRASRAAAALACLKLQFYSIASYSAFYANFRSIKTVFALSLYFALSSK